MVEIQTLSVIIQPHWQMQRNFTQWDQHANNVPEVWIPA
ncbi:unnamed protein product [Cylicostephanus goldi]|uniref:Uncharacterized protein n=1 Tax=Cylicostephanus goldi TaxID=71465 RepID=A0A3P6T3M9_CYLGO|nr:unnamed protein product [Cylicostephanus goldi]